ncbi:hypothetical protein D3C72_2069240 [compost metagenome]
MWLHFRLGGWWWRDLVDLAVLKWGNLSGGWHCFLVQCAATLLVVLGQEVGLLRRFLALEGGQGDFHGPANFFWLGKGKPQTKNQRQVQQGRQK